MFLKFPLVIYFWEQELLYSSEKSLNDVFVCFAALELKIKRENFIASEMDKDHKEEMGKRKPRPAKERNTLMVSGEAHPGAEASSV